MTIIFKTVIFLLPRSSTRVFTAPVAKKGLKHPCKQGAWSDQFESSLSRSSSTESKNTSPKSSPMCDGLRNAQASSNQSKRSREACAEKERVMHVNLFETCESPIYQQMKEEEELIKGVILKKRKQRGKKNKMVEIGRRYMMAFALWFRLIGGAGLFLGWTVGWFFHF